MTDVVWTPWRDHGELLTVRRYLYVHQDEGGQAKDMRRKGCEIVSRCEKSEGLMFLSTYCPSMWCFHRPQSAS